MTYLLKKINFLDQCRKVSAKRQVSLSWQAPYSVIVWPSITIEWKTKLSRYKLPYETIETTAEMF